MNVQMDLTNVIVMLTALTLWEATLAHVKLDIMGMDLPVQVSFKGMLGRLK